jgi:L-Ala-D/L-Glu epimerase / N-acetyl-D-glutamate racemase
MLASIEAFALRIPFKIAFKHASAERSSTQAVWVEARTSDGTRGYGEGCPREYVTSESVAGAREFIAKHRHDWCTSFDSAGAVRDWIERHSHDVDRNPAAWTAVELAVLDALGRARACSLESLLGLPELGGRFRYTAVIGDAPTEAFRAQLAHYLKAGFRQFKIKLSGDAGRDATKVKALSESGVSPEFVRADANNLWPEHESARAALQALGFPFFAVEEPIRAGDIEGMRTLAERLGTRIILDESLLRAEQLAALTRDPEHWVVNVRVSKMGGLLRSLDLVRQAKRSGFDLIVGAHVGETSVLTRAALTVAASAGDALVAQEGAFGMHLLEHDVAERPLMFGHAGTLDVESFGVSGAPGLGLTVVDALPLQD